MSNANSPWLWIDENPPTKAGWYAVSRCFDPEEGILPDAARWDGATQWDRTIIARSPDTFDAEMLAREWAYEHDMESLTERPQEAIR